MSGEPAPAGEGSSLNRPHRLSLIDATLSEPVIPEADPIERPHSAGEVVPEVHARRGRVRFNSKSEVNDLRNSRVVFPLRDSAIDDTRLQLPAHTRKSSKGTKDIEVQKKRVADNGENPFSDASAIEVVAPVPRKPRPSVLRNNSASSFTEDMMITDDGYTEPTSEKAFSAKAAQERAKRVASLVGHSASTSRSLSAEGFRSYPPSPSLKKGKQEDIPLVDMDRYNDGGLDSEEDDDETKERRGNSSTSEAHKLVRTLTGRPTSGHVRVTSTDSTALESGQLTPTHEQDYTEDYVARPDQYRHGVLSSLLKLYNPQDGAAHKRRTSSTGSYGARSGFSTPGSSGNTTPKQQKNAKWYHQKNQSRETLAGLVEASSKLAAYGGNTPTGQSSSKRPPMHGRTHSGGFTQAFHKISRPRLEDEIKITVHIAETLQRQKYLVRLCRALMAYGAPTHRLEEYMRMTARVLELDGQFLYIPGCMLVSFDDVTTHTTEVKLVRTNQGVNLGKLKDVHEIYKEVVHDVIGVEEATHRLDSIIREKPKYHRWFLVFVYGLASACVGPFAFEANFIDLPISFILGCVLGFLQLIVAPKSDLYANVFEISAAVITSFIARGFGSIPYNGGRLFCFSALAQSSIVLILPGYIILCGSLELQSKSIVAGSVRMVYAVIYSLFLGFGITIGTAMYGLMDSNATSATSCSRPMNQYVRFAFVPLFTMCLCIINQAKWKQTPVMLLISCTGYVVNFFTSKRFSSNAQLSQTLGALVIGVMGNLYSRLRHGVAAAALLPAIFVQVPSGLAASGSLLAGLTSADGITNTTNKTTTPVGQEKTELNSIVFNVGYSMIQVAIGITVGLFLTPKPTHAMCIMSGWYPAWDWPGLENIQQHQQQCPLEEDAPYSSLPHACFVLVLALCGLLAITNAAAIDTSLATSDHETMALEARQTYGATCSSVNGPGWDGFLRAHAAFTKIWASTPAGFCVASNNWACVACGYDYMFFWPDEKVAPKTVCYTRDQFGAVVTGFNKVAQQGQDWCSIRVTNVGNWGFGSTLGNNPIFHNRACIQRC
ncbi:hypothetical protein V495_00627 [Pseudogymnoascus sp. VKM F-4514 (FW-929)]|nr:hypothetical protein V495_00627 [Pseudogymnoascus sp. VKM F-4514 (FW-929)]KFY66000.1 hypothetical protein V497_01189 [Pseudogymnoascus sp. VKM F-4516 (FW-969)]